MINCDKCLYMFRIPDARHPNTMYCSAVRNGKEARMYCSTVNAHKTCRKFRYGGNIHERTRKDEAGQIVSR